MMARASALSRRSFLKAAGLAGLAAILTPPASSGASPADPSTWKVPTRPFGRHGRPVSILSLGGMFDIPNNQLLLRQALNWGVTYWDTAHSYGGGQSETGIGQYFAKYPQDRSKVFLVTKSGAWTLKGRQQELDESLARLKTDYVDLFFVHAVSSVSALDAEARRWAEKLKADGKIRLFGFSTHSNMARCLLDASALGWIDAIMMTYNYRIMHDDKMKAGVDACAKAGIGLTAMKTQGGGPVSTAGQAELALAGHFLQKGFTDAQAKLKAVWENPQIAAICSQMPNLSILKENVAAAVDPIPLSRADRQALANLAQQTAHCYCEGCRDICETVCAGFPIGDAMRGLMYRRAYGDKGLDIKRLTGLDEAMRRDLAQADFTAAESCCPRRLPIGRLMKEAAQLLA
jgi:hypothetical protein